MPGLALPQEPGSAPRPELLLLVSVPVARQALKSPLLVQRAWRQEIEACGLAPGGTGSTLLPVGTETLAQWFFGGREP